MYCIGDFIKFRKNKLYTGYIIAFYQGKFIVSNLFNRNQYLVSIDEIIKKL